MYCTPGPDSSSLIKTEKAVPINPENSAKIRYSVPISFALLERNQRSPHIEISDFFISFIKTGSRFNLNNFITYFEFNSHIISLYNYLY